MFAALERNSSINNTVTLANKVEEYSILGTYKMPNFPIPNGYTSIEYLKEINIKDAKGLLKKGYNIKS